MIMINIQILSSPISWIKDTISFYVEKNDDILLKKILFGLTFHGYVYDKKNGNPTAVINSNQFLQLIDFNEDKLKLNYDENEYEYTIDIADEKIISYPFLKYIEKRLQLSKELKIGGCGIWDIGNGKEGLLAPL